MNDFIQTTKAKTVVLNKANVETVYLQAVGFDFGRRIFIEPLEYSKNKHFVVMIELKTQNEQVLQNTRLVLVDLRDKKQWVTAWNLWQIYTIEKLIEFDGKSASRWSIKKVFNSLFNLQGKLEVKTKRMNTIWAEIRHSVFLPVIKSKFFVDYVDKNITNLESNLDGRRVEFDSLKFVYFERDYKTEVTWSSINKITFQKRIDFDAEFCELKFFGSVHQTVHIPCQGLDEFIIELNQRYKISREIILNLYESTENSDDRIQILWLLNSEKAAKISSLPELQFHPDFFKKGLLLESGSLLPWNSTIENLKSKGLVVTKKRNDHVIYELRENAWIGPFLVPGLYCYESSSKGPEWIISGWSFDFVRMEPEINSVELKNILLKLATSSSTWFEGKPFNCHIFNEYVLLQLDNRNGDWSGFINLSFELYWSIMQAVHPWTQKIKVTDSISVKASTSSVQSATSKVSGELKEIPSPSELADKFLVFWKDQGNQIEGASCFNSTVFWEPGSLKDLYVKKSTFPGERGMEDYVIFSLELILTKDRSVSYEYYEIDSINPEEILKWYKGIR